MNLRKKQIPRYSHWGVAITIYRVGDRYSAQFTLSGHDRRRIEKSTEAMALQGAKDLIEKRLQVDPSIPLEERYAVDILAQRGISLIEAARMIDQQLTLLDPLGATIPDAVALYVQQNRGSDVTVEKVVDELMRSKSRDVGIHHLSDIRSRLKNRFCADFGDQPICSITGANLAHWIDELQGSSRNRRNFHSALVGLFKFAKERGYLPENLLTAPEKIRKPKAGRVIRKIYSPEELKLLISAGLAIRSEGLLPLLIQSFTGVRSEELRQTDPKKDRLRWEDVLLEQEDAELHVREEVSKTGTERFVFIPSCLRAWITVLRKASSGPIYGGNYLWKDYYAIAAKAGLPWKKNAPRKSFNTYHAALSGSLSDTAGEAGNSEQMIRQYYRKTLPQAARTAREWFSLGPEQFIKVEHKNRSAA